MLPALPRVRYAKNQHRQLGWLQGRQRQQGKEMGGKGNAGQRKDTWESKLSFAICIILYISQAPHTVIKVPSYRVWFVQGWLQPTSYPKNMQFNREVAQSNTTHFDLVWVLALLFSVTTHFRANTIFPFQRTCRQHFSQQRLTHCPIQSLFPNICS